MAKQGNNEYEAMLEQCVDQLERLGVSRERGAVLTDDAAEQYYHKGQYFKRFDVNEAMHDVFRLVVKPYARHVAECNNRRYELIDKECGGMLLQGEKEELESLEIFVRNFIDRDLPSETRSVERLSEQFRA